MLSMPCGFGGVVTDPMYNPRKSSCSRRRRNSRAVYMCPFRIPIESGGVSIKALLQNSPFFVYSPWRTSHASIIVSFINHSFVNVMPDCYAPIKNSLGGFSHVSDKISMFYCFCSQVYILYQRCKSCVCSVLTYNITSQLLSRAVISISISIMCCCQM